MFKLKQQYFSDYDFQVSGFSGLNVKPLPAHIAVLKVRLATSYRVPVLCRWRRDNFNKSNLEDDGKSYWLIRLWWHPSGSPLRKYVPMSMQWSWDGEWAKASLSWIMDGGEGERCWIRTHGKSCSTHSDTPHTQRQCVRPSVLWGRFVGEWSCSPVSRFGADVLRGLLLERGELGIYQTTSLSRSLPSSASMRPRCDESNILCGVS